MSPPLEGCSRMMKLNSDVGEREKNEETRM